MTQRLISRRERGSVLVIAMTIIVILTMLGAMVMRSVGQDVEVAGAERSADQAMYIAEAGLIWGRIEVVDVRTEATFEALLAAGLTAVPSTDAIATGESTWLYLTPSTPPSYGGGNYQVAISDDAFVEGGGDDNATILMRALGTSAGGAKRLVEAAVYDSTR